MKEQVESCLFGAVGCGSLVYERKIRKTIEKAFKGQDPQYVKLEADRGGGYNAHVPDIIILLSKIPYAFEVKKSLVDQMGSTKIKYDGKVFYMEKEDLERIDEETFEAIKDILYQKQKDVDELLAFLRRQEPVEYHEKINRIPFNVSKEAWNLAVSNGLLKPINIRQKYDERFLINHYAKKNCNYIQIGGAGLFYLNQNILNLPVPRLKGEIQLEIRLKRSGSRPIKAYDIRAASVEMRVNARLKFKDKSPYSLDNPDDVKFLFREYLGGTNV